MTIMISLKIDNSSCRIAGLGVEEEKTLRGFLSYVPDPKAAYFGGGHRGGRRYLIDKAGNFPSGLLYIVEAFLASREYARNDVRRVPEPRQGLFTLSLAHTPYAAQQNAVAALLGASGGICAMPTGSGKSLTIGLLIAALQLKTLIVVPTLELKRQLSDTLRGLFGSLDNIDIENIDSSRLPKLKGHDVLIVDECHHSAAATYRKLNKKTWTGIYYRYCFTATPYRSRDEETILMETLTGPVRFKLTYREAVAAGLIVPIEAYYIDLPKRPVEGYTWAQVYSELVVNNDTRNAAIADLIERLSAAKKSTLVLVKEICHGEKLAALTSPTLPFASGLGGDARGLIDDFNATPDGVLIGTTGVLGEGVDTRPAEYIIIAGLGKSKPAFMQQCGRGVRRYPGKESAKIILIRDPSHKWCLNHFKAQCKVLRDEYGAEAVKLL